jgi:signal transduction histidine kinase
VAVTSEPSPPAALPHVAAVVGHELRNPLGAAVTGASLLREMVDEGDPRRTVVDGVLRDLDRAARLLSSYLDFARAAAPRRRDVDVLAICIELAERHRGVHAFAQSACRVTGDRDLIERALENLIENALHAGARTVRLMLERTPAVLRLRVADDGPGIPAERLPRLFEPGHGVRGGTGLGLAIAAATVAGHGGSIRCETGERGTTFVIELPSAVAVARTGGAVLA